MRFILSGLLTRLVFLTVPLLLVADFLRALGKSVSIGLIIWSFAVPAIGIAIDTARVGRAKSGPDDQLNALTVLRPPFRFRLRMLFLLILIVSVYCSFRFSGTVRQRRAIAELRAAGVPIAYDDRNESWRATLFGDDMFGTVTDITLRNDQEVAKAASSVQSRRVTLHGHGVTDASVEALLRSTQLQKIVLSNTNITIEGADKIRRSLPQCAVEVYPP